MVAKISPKHRPWPTNQRESSLKTQTSNNLRFNKAPCHHWGMTVRGQALTINLVIIAVPKIVKGDRLGLPTGLPAQLLKNEHLQQLPQ